MPVPRWGLEASIVLLVVCASTATAQGAGGGRPVLDDRTLVALAVALAVADAQEAVEGVRPEPGGAVPADGPQLELVASVRAKTLVFDEVPRADVIFGGSDRRTTVWKTERENLPVHPKPGVVYHDVAVRLTITSSVEDLTALLGQAKRASRGVRLEGDGVAAAPVVPAAPPIP